MPTKKTTKKTATKPKKVVRAKAKATPKAKAVRSRSKAVAKSFQIVRDRAPFVSYSITTQTIYWGVLLVYILLLSLWILNIQLDTLRIIDKINAL